MNPLDPKRSPGSAALDALRRQQQQASSSPSSSSSSSCNAMQRGATPRNAMQPISPPCKTNPPKPAALVPATPAARTLTPVTAFVLQSAIEGACNAVQPHATPCNPVQPNRPVEKTNPPPPISNSQHAATSPLTPRQLAAARLLAAGQSIANVSIELGLNRSTVWRWTCDPAFRDELRELHRRLSAPARPGARR